MNALILYALLSASLFYLGSRAKITMFLWSTYPRWLAELMDCAACSGTWFGFVLALTVGRYMNLEVLGLAGDAWLTPIIVAGCMMVLTPIVAGVMHTSMLLLGSAVESDEIPDVVAPSPEYLAVHEALKRNAEVLKELKADAKP